MSIQSLSETLRLAAVERNQARANLESAEDAVRAAREELSVASDKYTDAARALLNVASGQVD